MKRRGLIKGMLGALFAPSLAEQEKFTRTGPMLDTRAANAAIDPVRIAANKSAKYFQNENVDQAFKNIANILCEFGDDEEKSEYMREHVVSRIDPDLHINKSLSLAAKMYLQKERDWKKHRDRFRNEGRKLIGGT